MTTPSGITTPSGSAILADIGGTNARFALLVDAEIGPFATYAVADYPTPARAMRAFLDGPAAGQSPKRALLAAAGPPENGRIALTNAPWTLDAKEIRAELDMEEVRVLNDFEALGWTLPALRAEDLLSLGVWGPGERGTMAVMGPGSGFGLAAMVLAGGRESVLVTEGGHATLPGGNRREDSIIEALRERHGHVSVERVLSGPGLVLLYRTVAELDGIAAPDRTSGEIVSHALAGDCPVSRDSLELFCGFLGVVAGNVALTLGARGGVFIGGGVVPHFAEFLKRSAFRERFEAKGRMSSYLQRIPTAVIMHPNPAFLGLSYLARTSARQAMAP